MNGMQTKTNKKQKIRIEKFKKKTNRTSYCFSPKTKLTIRLKIFDMRAV